MFLFALTAPLRADLPLKPGDIIDIRLSGVDPLFVSEFASPACTIDEQGNINLTYLGKIRAAGMQANQLQTVIEQKLKAEKIYTRPTITINVQTQNRFVIVSGAVKGPGRVPYTADMTIMGAIGAVGGVSDFAGDKIDLTREGKTTVNSRKAIKKDPSKDTKLLPGDQIEVKQGGFL